MVSGPSAKIWSCKACTSAGATIAASSSELLEDRLPTQAGAKAGTLAVAQWQWQLFLEAGQSSLCCRVVCGAPAEAVRLWVEELHEAFVRQLKPQKKRPAFFEPEPEALSSPLRHKARRTPPQHLTLNPHNPHNPKP